MRLGRPTVAVILTEDERVQLESWAHRSRSAPQLARRARLVLACERWTPKFGQLAKVGSRPRRRSLACHGRDGVIRLS